MAYVLDSYVVEFYVAHDVVVSAHDGEASLTVELEFAVVDDVDVAVAQAADGVGRSFDAEFGGASVQADVHGVGHVGPQCGVFHHYVAASAVESFAGCIDGMAVVAVAAEYTVVAHVVGGEYVHSVAPAVVADRFDIGDVDRIASSDGDLCHYHAVDVDIS